MKRTNNKKKKRLARKFMVAFLSTLLICGVAAGVFIYVYASSRTDDELKAITVAIESNLKKVANPITEVFIPIPDRTNFVIFGVDDDGTRTDTMMVGCFNSLTEQLSIISVPRDTKVTMPKERRDILSQRGRWTPSDGVMKLNEVHHYAGKDLGVEFAVKQIEELLGIKLEYYVKVNLKAFEYIVDSMDGVEFDVPQRMDYDDPYQNLHIHLKPGLQRLSGKDALGMVRFRSYARADWQRMEVQQDFVKALISQALGKENIVNNAGTLITAAYNYVETNFQVADAPKYIKYVKRLSADSIVTASIPSTPTKIGEKDYVTINDKEMKEIVQSVFYDTVKTADLDGVQK